MLSRLMYVLNLTQLCEMCGMIHTIYLHKYYQDKVQGLKVLFFSNLRCLDA